MFENLILICFLFMPVAFVYIWICIRKTFWLIAAMAIYLPFEQFLSKWYPDILYAPLRYLGEATIFLLLAIYLFDRVIVKRKKLPKTPIDLPVLMLLITIILSTIVNSVPIPVAVLGVKNLLRFISLFYLIILVHPLDGQTEKLFKVLFAIAIFQASIAILQSLIGKPAYDFFSAREVVVGGQFIRRASVAKLISGSYRTMVFGTMERYNILGNYVAMWLGISGTLFLSKQRLLNIRVWHIMLLLTALILSYSRMSWIALFIGGITFFTLSKKFKIVAYLSALFVIILTIIMVKSFSANSIDINAVDVGLGGPLTRYLSTFSPEYIKLLVSDGRGYSYFSIVPEVLRVSPLFGLGPGMIASDVSNLISTTSALNRLTLDNPQALRYLGDAGFATIISQLGIMGLCAFVLLFFQLFRTSFAFLQCTDGEPWTLLAWYIVVLVMIIIFNLVSFALIYRVPSYYFWMFSGFAVLQMKRIKNKPFP